MFNLFYNDKPRVSPLEWKKARQALNARGFTVKEVDQLEGLLGGDMDEQIDSQKGVDKYELEHLLKWLRGNKSRHTFSDNQISDIESVMKKYL